MEVEGGAVLCGFFMPFSLGSALVNLALIKMRKIRVKTADDDFGEKHLVS